MNVSPMARWTAIAVMVALGLVLRTWDLSRRVMHADEANQAVKTGALLENGRYVFDARDHHGPTLYFLALPIALVRGERTLADLTEELVRCVPAAFGTLAVLLLATAGPVGSGGSRTLAAGLLAVSPPAVYYSRYYIQEVLLVAFTLLAFVAVQRWWRRGDRWSAASAGVAAGLMLATKETAVLIMAVGAVAAFASGGIGRPRSVRVAGDLVTCFAATILVAGMFYSSFGQNLPGVRDALVAPFTGVDRALATSGHDKSWTYYLQLLVGTTPRGWGWSQIAFVLVAVAGAASGFVRGSAWVRGVTVYAVLVLLVISAVPYKTPWNVLHVVPPLCVLAAAGIATIATRQFGFIPVAAVAALLVVTQAGQTHAAVFAPGAQARTPWAYVHSSPDVVKFRPAVERALAAHPDLPVRIISEEYWPLPWYLRGFPRVGYWTTPPQTCDGAVVVASASLAPAVRQQLKGAYEESYLGLRPGFVCVVFTRISTP